MTTLTTAAVATTIFRSERMRASLMRIRALSVASVTVAAFGLLLSCANKQQAAEATAAVARALPDIAEPSGMLGELSVRRPALSYKAFRDLGGPLAGLLPAGFPLLVASLFGLPPLAADSFDAELPMYGALVQGAANAPSWVLAVHAVSGPELLAKLSTGDHAPYRAVSSGSAGLVLLQASSGPDAGPPAQVSLAVFDNYLLAASTADALLAAGPYAARMLPKHAPASAAIAFRFSKQALSSRVVPVLRGLWASYRTNLSHSDELARSAHGGRAPDFADPAQIILGADALIESALSMVDGASALELTVEPFADRLEATIVLQPGAGSEAQSKLSALAAGTAEPLLSLPAATQFALGFRRTAAARDAAASAAGDDWVRLLGARLPESGAKQVRAALADWELGRGTQTSYGFIAGSAPGAYLVTDVADAARLEHAARGLFGLLAVPGLRAPLTEFLGQPQVRQGAAPNTEPFPNISRKQITFAPAPGRQASLPPLSFAWVVDEKLGVAAAGKNADPLLEQVVHSAHGQAETLASKAGIAEAVQRMGDHVALFAYMDGRLGLASDSAVPAPLLLSVGQRATAGYLRVEVAKPAIDLALHSAIGL